MKKMLLKRMLAVTVCTAALAGIYGEPVYAATDLDLGKIQLSGSEGVIVAADGNFVVATDGDFYAAGGKFFVDPDGTIYGADGNFYVEADGATTIGSSLSVDDNAYIDGNLTAKGDTNLKSNLKVNKSLSAAGDKFKVDANGATDIKSTLDVYYDTTLRSDLWVGGDTNLNGNLEVNDTFSAAGGNFYVDTDGSFYGAGGNFYVGPDGDFYGAGGNFYVDTDGSFSASGGNFSVAADGATDIAANLNVKDDATIGKDLTVKGDSYLQGKLEVTDKASLKGGLEVTGGTTTDTLTVTGAANVGGDLTVNGALSAADGNFAVANDGSFTAAGGNFSVAADGATNIAANLSVKDDIVSEKGDVKIKDENANEIKLSDLGYLGDLNEELAGNQQYLDNPTAVGAFNAEAAIRRGEIARLDNRIDELDTRVNKVGAMAAAIASLKSIGYDPEAPSEFSVGVGQYKGKTGIALGFFHYPNKDFMLNFSLSSSSGEMMGGIGATWRFGKAKG